MRFLSDRQIKQLLCDHFSKNSTEPNLVRTEIRSQPRNERDKKHGQLSLLRRSSL